MMLTMVMGELLIFMLTVSHVIIKHNHHYRHNAIVWCPPHRLSRDTRDVTRDSVRTEVGASALEQKVTIGCAGHLERSADASAAAAVAGVTVYLWGLGVDREVA
eukprot:scpid59524/ scgid14846/ 